MKTEIMKTLSLVALAIAMSVTGFAQTPEEGNQSIKQMTFEEANELNGTASPTINGRPYSEFKAEQEALKRERQQIELQHAIEIENSAGDGAPAAAMPATPASQGSGSATQQGAGQSSEAQPSAEMVEGSEGEMGILAPAAPVTDIAPAPVEVAPVETSPTYDGENDPRRNPAPRVQPEKVEPQQAAPIITPSVEPITLPVIEPDN